MSFRTQPLTSSSAGASAYTFVTKRLIVDSLNGGQTPREIYRLFPTFVYTNWKELRTHPSLKPAIVEEMDALMKEVEMVNRQEKEKKEKQLQQRQQQQQQQKQKQKPASTTQTAPKPKRRRTGPPKPPSGVEDESGLSISLVKSFGQPGRPWPTLLASLRTEDTPLEPPSYAQDWRGKSISSPSLGRLRKCDALFMMLPWLNDKLANEGPSRDLDNTLARFHGVVYDAQWEIRARSETNSYRIYNPEYNQLMRAVNTADLPGVSRKPLIGDSTAATSEAKTSGATSTTINTTTTTTTEEDASAPNTDQKVGGEAGQLEEADPLALDSPNKSSPVKIRLMRPRYEAHRISNKRYMRPGPDGVLILDRRRYKRDHGILPRWQMASRATEGQSRGLKRARSRGTSSDDSSPASSRSVNYDGHNYTSNGKHPVRQGRGSARRGGRRAGLARPQGARGGMGGRDGPGRKSRITRANLSKYHFTDDHCYADLDVPVLRHVLGDIQPGMAHQPTQGEKEAAPRVQVLIPPAGSGDRV